MTLQGSMDHARRTGIADLQTRLVDYARHNRSRRERGLPEVSQRRLGDAMGALGHRNKLRLVSGRIHYQGLRMERAGCRRES